MKNPRMGFFLKVVVLSLICLIFSGCGGSGANITADNYEQIKNGMTLKEVETILGPAGEDATDAVLLGAQ